MSMFTTKLADVGTRRIGRVVAGLIGFVGFAGYLQIALEMPLGGTGNPGPGLWPTMVGYVGIAMSLMLVLEAVFMANSTDGNIEFPRQKVLLQVSMFLGLSLVYIIVVPILGQLVTSALFFTAVIKLLSKRNILLSLLIGVVSAVVVWFMFVQLLSLRLPSGIFNIGGLY
jgi:putative tricarboxylic transport membrane protein